MSKIEWTEQTWNPSHGCTKVSPGCKHCYAETMANRLQAMKAGGYDNGFAPTAIYSRLNIPRNRKQPTLYFVNSMGDLFHPAITREFQIRVMEVITECQHHKFQILTKYTKEMRAFFDSYYAHITMPQNFQIGVSVEDIEYGIPRINAIRGMPNTFLSIEPLLEDVSPALDLTGIHWVIVGGESGPKARPMHPEWVRRIEGLCFGDDVPFFFKQWGTWIHSSQYEPNPHTRRKPLPEYSKVGKGKAGHLLDGKEYRQFPDFLRADAPF
jgi:protein gp37